MQGKAQTVGNGMRTIAINIANMAEETDTWTAANGKVNVALKDSEGNIRSTYEIMKDLHTGIEGTSLAWNDLTEAEQNEIAVAAAGKTRYDVFTSSMGNFESAIYATETAMNSSGSAMKENEATLDSVEGHLSRLKSAFENFAYQTLSSDVVKGFLDVGTAILTFLGSDVGQAVGKWSLFGGAILAASKALQKLQAIVSAKGWIGSLKYLWSGDQGGKVAKNVSGINKETEAVNRNTRAWQQNAAARKGATTATGRATAATQTSTKTLGKNLSGRDLKSGNKVYLNTAGNIGQVTKAASKGTKALSGLKTAASGVAGALGITPWTAVIAALGLAGTAIYKQIKKFDDLRDSAIESADGVDSLKQQIQELEAVENRTVDQDAELRQLEGRLAAEEKITEQKKKQAAAEYERKSLSFAGGADGYTAATSRVPAAFKNYDSVQQITKQEKAVQDYQKHLSELIQLEAEYNSASDSEKPKIWEELSKEQEKSAKKLEKIIDYQSEMAELKEQGMLPESMEDVYKDLTEWVTEYGEAASGGYTKAFEAAQAIEGLDFTDKDQVQELGETLLTAFDGTKDDVEKLKTLKTALTNTGEEGQKAFGKLASSIEGVEFDKKDRMKLDPTQVEEYAKQMGMAEDTARDFLNLWASEGAINWTFNADSIKQDLSSVGDGVKQVGDKVVATQKDFDAWASSENLTPKQAKEAVKTFEQANGVVLDLDGSAQQLAKSASGLGKNFVQMSQDGKKIESINFDNMQTLFDTMGVGEEKVNKFWKAMEQGDAIIEGKGWAKYQKQLKKVNKEGKNTVKQNKRIKDSYEEAAEGAEDTGKKSKDSSREIEKGSKDASKGLGKLGTEYDKLGKTKAKPEIDAEGADETEKKVKDVEEGVKDVDNAKGTAQLDANDEASGKTKKAKQGVSSFDGMSALAILQALNGVTPGMNAAMAMLSLFTGMPFYAILQATDDASGTTQQAQSTATTFANTPYQATLSAIDNASSTANYVKSILDSLPSSKTINIHTNYTSSGKPPKEKAKGKRKGEEGGLSWVGDEGSASNPKPELIQTKNGAYLAGTKGWEMVHLDRDDIVYTAAETRRLLSKYQLDGIGGLIPRYAKGKKSKKQKRIERLQEQFDKKLSRLEDRRDMYNWSDATYRKKYNALYKQYQKKIKKISKKKGLGSDRKWDKKVAIRETRNDAAVSSIETAIEGLDAYISGYSASGLDSSRKSAMAQIDAALKKVKQARKANKISAEEAKEYQKEIQEARMEVYRKEAELQVQSLKREKTTYAKSVSYIKTMYQQKKLSAEDYYQYLQDLSDQAYENEINKLEKQQEKTEAQLDLMDEYVSKQIDALEKQKEALETQNEEQETTNELMEAEAELARAKAQRVKVYREGKGFGYEYDAEEIKEAQQAVQEAETNKEIEELEKLIEQWESISERLDEVETDAGIKDLENIIGSTAEQLFGSLGMDPEKWAEMAKNLHSQSMGIEDLIEYLEEQQELGYTIEQALNSSSGTVSQSLLNSYIGKNKFASGTLSAMGGLSLVGENGAELRVLNRGDGIIPSKITSNLMQWGNISPSKLVDEIKVKETPVSQEYKYSFDKLVLPNVKNADEFVSALKQLPNQAIQMSNKRK